MPLLALILGLGQAPAVDCEQFAARMAEPIIVRLEPLTGAALGAQPLAAGRYALGKFIVERPGMIMHSNDTRVGGFVLDGQRDLHHVCGYEIRLPPTARDGSPTHEIVLSQKWRTPAAPPAAIRAQKVGATPVLDGHSPGPSWPLSTSSGDAFIGIMHPQDRPSETTLVLFASKQGQVPAVVLARLPFRFQSIRALPIYHATQHGIWIEALQADGTWRRLDLRIDDADLNALAAQLD
jgi:hypothetical protein